MAELAQPGDELGLQRDGGMIGSDGDAHGASPRRSHRDCASLLPEDRLCRALQLAANGAMIRPMVMTTIASSGCRRCIAACQLARRPSRQAGRRPPSPPAALQTTVGADREIERGGDIARRATSPACRRVEPGQRCRRCARPIIAQEHRRCSATPKIRRRRSRRGARAAIGPDERRCRATRAAASRLADLDPAAASSRQAPSD